MSDELSVKEFFNLPAAKITSEHSKGRLIIFEGIDGSGKTTAVKIASEHLSRLGIPHICTKEPYGLDAVPFPNENSCQECATNAIFFKIGAFVASRELHIKDVILPALQEGKIVLCDRFIESTFAYQGINEDATEVIESIYPQWGKSNKFMGFSIHSILLQSMLSDIEKRLLDRGENFDLDRLKEIQARYYYRYDYKLQPLKHAHHETFWNHNEEHPLFESRIIAFIDRAIFTRGA